MVTGLMDNFFKMADLETYAERSLNSDGQVVENPPSPDSGHFEEYNASLGDRATSNEENVFMAMDVELVAENPPSPDSGHFEEYNASLGDRATSKEENVFMAMDVELGEETSLPGLALLNDINPEDVFESPIINIGNVGPSRSEYPMADINNEVIEDILKLLMEEPRMTYNRDR